jgi:ribosomal-protein-alanine N-acetyltransferase
MTARAFPLLETERLVLRQARQADAPTFLKVAQDDAVMRYYGMEPFTTEAQAVSEIEWQRRVFADGTGIRWVITERGRDLYIGDLGYSEVKARHRRAEIGYKLAPGHWRRGLMTEALAAVLEYGFASMGLNRIEALVDPRNVASVGLLRKLGFVREGVLRDYEYEKGSFIDLIMMSLSRREWRQ